MAPIHCAMNWRHRVVLKEDVKAAGDSAQTIRIGEPAWRGRDVKGGEAGISHGAKGYLVGTLPGSISVSAGWRVQGRRVSRERSRTRRLGRLLARGGSAPRAGDRLRGPRACAQFG